MQKDQLSNISYFEGFTRNSTNGYILINPQGKILSVNQAVLQFRGGDLGLPEQVRELFPSSGTGFDAAFSTCLATGKSQGLLYLQTTAEATAPVDAYFSLCTFTDGSFQIILSLKPGLNPSVLPGLTVPDLLPDVSPANENLFIQAQTLAQVGNYKFDFQSGLVDWTPAMFRIFGLPQQDAGLPYADFITRIHPEDRADFLAESQQVTRSATLLKKEIRIIRGDATTGFIRITAQPLLDAAGECIGVFGTITDQTEQKRTEKKLRTALSALEKVLDNSPDIMVTISPGGQILQTNKACEKILGIPSGESLGENYWKFIHPDDIDKTLASMTEVSSGIPSFNFENRCLRKDQSFVTIFWSSYWSEEVQNFFCVGRDGTEIKNAQQAVVASEERFRSLVQNGSDLLGLISPEGFYTYVSDSVKPILGYEPEALVGKMPFEFVHPDDLPRLLQNFEEIQHARDLVIPNFRFRAADGQWRWMESLVTNHLENPFIRGFAVTSRDVTERREAELKILESEQRYKSLFEYHPDAVYSLDREGRFLTANPQVGKLTGSSPDQILSENFQGLIVPEYLPDTLANFIYCLQGHSTTYESAIYDVQGQRVDIEVTNIPIYTNGEITGVFGIAKNITDLKRSHRERQQLVDRLEEKNRHLEQFAYIVSHNLRAPVANIMGLTNLFSARQVDCDLNQQVVSNLQKTAKNLDAIVKDLNQILSIRSELNQPRERIDLTEMLASINITFREDLIRNQGTLEADFSAAPTVFTIRSYLHNIILGLIGNAIHYRSPEEPLFIRLRTYPHGHRTCLEVQDNSVTFKSQKSDIFNQFRRVDTHADGKGLRLHLIKSQVEALGSELNIDTQPGLGSTIKIFL